jgi:hypothetical protein
VEPFRLGLKQQRSATRGALRCRPLLTGLVFVFVAPFILPPESLGASSIPIEQPTPPSAITPRRTSDQVFEAETARLPKSPTLLRSFESVGPRNVFKCEREILYRGRTVVCDSPKERDGEGLRPILASVPESLAALDAYQKGRKAVNSYAYVGTAGLGMALGGYALSRTLDGDAALKARQIGIGGGLGLLAVGTVLGLIHLQKNEDHLLESIQIFNGRNPGDPIEVRFEAKISP